MAFESSDSKILGQQLKVQELVIRKADTHLYTVSGSDVIVDLGETVSACVAALHLDNSVPGVVMKAASAVAVSGTTITVTVTLDTSDVLILKYIVA